MSRQLSGTTHSSSKHSRPEQYHNIAPKAIVSLDKEEQRKRQDRRPIPTIPLLTPPTYKEKGKTEDKEMTDLTMGEGTGQDEDEDMHDSPLEFKGEKGRIVINLNEGMPDPPLQVQGKESRIVIDLMKDREQDNPYRVVTGI